MTQQDIYSLEQLLAMPGRQRGQMLNALSGIKGVHLLGTRSASGVDNLAVFNSVLHIGASPPALGLLFRPLTVQRDSYDNIHETGAFTLNLITANMLNAAHHCAAKWPTDTSEFTATGLTPLRTEHPAPFVAESPIAVGLTLVEEIPIAFNDTRLLIGAVQEVRVPAGAVAEDGWVRLDPYDIVSVAGLDSYYLGRLLARKSYAQPDAAPYDLPIDTEEK
jgi:flavin reductase (DIM6/NTAB) family NADH-FMN oxidoreductase RutF